MIVDAVDDPPYLPLQEVDMGDSSQRYSVKALDEFLAWLGEKGLMPAQTVGARRAASSKMLGILDPSEADDLRDIDLDDIAQRFANLEGKKYTPDSLKTYKSRVSKSLEDFFRYLDDPASFRPTSNARRSNGKRPRERGDDRVDQGNGDLFEEPTPSVLNLPVPIRENLVVQISGLPFDLTVSEATKIANVVRAMASEGE